MKYTSKTENSLDRLHKPNRRVYDSYITKSIGKNDISKYYKEDREKYLKNQSENEIRMEIHNIIYQGIFNGTSILDIIQKLNSDERFSKFSQYFESWINEQKNKKEEIIAKIKKERESGKSREEILDALYKFTKWSKYRKYFEELLDSTINEEEKEIEL